MTNRTQRGSALIISLIILIILMLLGVTAMNTSDTVFKLAGNLQFANNAMNSAEAVLSQVENDMEAGTIDNKHADFFADPAVNASNSGFYSADSTINPLNTPWDNTDSVLTAGGRFIIQLMSTDVVVIGSDAGFGAPPSADCKKANTYRITARSTSSRGAIKHVQSYFSALTPC